MMGLSTHILFLPPFHIIYSFSLVFYALKKRTPVSCTFIEVRRFPEVGDCFEFVVAAFFNESASAQYDQRLTIITSQSFLESTFFPALRLLRLGKLKSESVKGPQALYQFFLTPYPLRNCLWEKFREESRGMCTRAFWICTTVLFPSEEILSKDFSPYKKNPCFTSIQFLFVEFKWERALTREA